MSDLKVTVSKIIAAPITSVFDAWLEPTTLEKFILPMPGMDNPKVENDPIEGGAFAITMQVGDNKIPHTGKYLEIDRPNKIVFTWQSPESADDSVVTLSFNETEDGKTKIDLSHDKFLDEQRRANHEGGWSNILSELSQLFN